MLKNSPKAATGKCLLSAAMKTFNTILPALLCFCLFFSCKQPPQPDAALKRRADSVELQAKAAKMALEMLQRAKDSIANARGAENHEAAARPEKSYGPCPAVVRTCAVVSDLRGGKAIVVTLKNNSSKKIDAVKLGWTVFNKKDQKLGASSGMAKKDLAKGRTASYSWGINAPTGTRGKATIVYLHFKDGSIWK